METSKGVIIADTSGLISLFFPSDHNHEVAVQAANRLRNDHKDILIPAAVFVEFRVLGNNGTRNGYKRSMLGRKCLTFCERQANMEKWAWICLQKSSTKAETCAATFAKPNRQPIELYAFMP